MRNNIDKLGDIIKTARKNNNLTREELAEKINIPPRSLMSIENENKKPSYNVLINLVRELGTCTDTIFFPEKLSTNTKVELLIQLLYLCDERELKAATVVTKGLPLKLWCFRDSPLLFLFPYRFGVWFNKFPY